MLLSQRVLWTQHALRHAAVVTALAGGLSLFAGSTPQQQGATPSPQPLRHVHVVGGHDGMKGDGRRVYKPLQHGKRGRAEADFYDRVCAPGRRGRPPAVFMPDFHGYEERVEGDGGLDSGSCGKQAKSTRYLVLEDITAPFERPAIMDIKMGVQTWDEDASPAKVEQERSKYPTQQLVGFRFTGMRVPQQSPHSVDGFTAAPKEHGRAFGYALTRETLHHAFYEYLHDGSRLRLELIPPLLARLRDVQGWFREQGEFRFYGSSLLFVYDAAAPAEAPRLDVRMIDFAHVWPIKEAGGRDDGYLLGLDSVIVYLEDLLLRHAGLPPGDVAGIEGRRAAG